ncbi:hypothetical protein KEM54_001880, partial [Ascosphaera aggregata]
MFVDINCWPPLARTTELKRLTFAVTFKTKEVLTPANWVVEVQHDITSSTWQSLPLTPSSSAIFDVSADSSVNVQTFTGSIAFPEAGRHCTFDIRYKANSSDTTWKLASEQSRTTKGEIVFEPPVSQTTNLKDFKTYVDGLSNNVVVSSSMSQAAGASLWKIEGKVSGTNSDEPNLEKTTLGIFKDTVKYSAVVRDWTPWLKPQHGGAKFDLPDDGVLVSFLRKDGSHLALLALSGVEDVLTVINSGENGEV